MYEELRALRISVLRDIRLQELRARLLHVDPCFLAHDRCFWSTSEILQWPCSLMWLSRQIFSPFLDIMSIRKRKASSSKEEKRNPASSPAAPPVVNSSDIFMLVSLVFFLFCGIWLIYYSTTLGGQQAVCGPIDVTQNIVRNGEVHDMIRKVAERNPQYEPQFLSKSILQLDNLLSPAESEELIRIANKHGYEESLILNHETGSAIEKSTRTSQTLWCRDACSREKIVRTLSKRLEDLLQISERHMEPIQLLQYKEGQFYGNHSDFAYRDISRLPGPRVFTLLFYLSEVEGGETLFSHVGIKAVPRPGRAVLWSNTPDHNVHLRDDDAYHEALPVKAGVKYAGNVWIHLRNYRDPLELGCL